MGYRHSSVSGLFRADVTKIARFNRLLAQGAKRQEPACHPGFDMDETVIASR